MPVSALVVTLDRRPALAAEAWAHLQQHPALTLGAAQAERLPAVLVTDTLSESERVVQGLFAIPGVAFVDVIAVDFSDLPSTQSHIQEA